MKKSKLIGYYGYWVLLTYLSVVFSVIGIYFSIQKNVFASIVCLMLSGVCDMFDGTVAKLKKRNEDEKRYGTQIDSLADIVGFGVLPVSIAYAIYASSFENNIYLITNLVIFVIYVLAALIRLAYFNVQEIKLQNKNVDRMYYEGLPVTSVALVIPLVYIVCTLLSIPLTIVFNKLLLLLSLAFVFRIKIPKLRGKQLFVVLTIGILVLVAMIRAGIK